MSTILVQVIVGGLLMGAVYALFSSGLTLIWGMMNIVNFAHGDFVMLGMYVAFVVWTLFGAGPMLGAPIAALVLATLGIIVYFALVRSNAIAGLIPVHSGSIQFRGQEIGGQPAFSIVRQGLALSPEGWRLFVQQSVENNLILGATPLRASRAPRRCSIGSTTSFQSSRSGGGSGRAPCPAASGRCWRSVAR